MAQPSMVTTSKEEKPPWSPVGLAIITLILSAGGAIVTLQNLRRMGEIDSRSARAQSIITIIVFAIGYSILVLLTNGPSDALRTGSSDSTGSAVLAGGISVAVYLVQHRPFRAWKSSHKNHVSPWLQAVGLSLVYQVLTFLVAVPIFLILSGLHHAMAL